MTDPALALAALRAGGRQSLAERERSAAEAVAMGLGRKITELDTAHGKASITLGFAEGFEPNPSEGVLSVRGLSPIPLIALATCLGLCWTDVGKLPYPGHDVEVERVLEVAAGLGAPHSHLLGALRNELTMAGLVELDGPTVRLGYAVAAWTNSQVDALRRFVSLLPRGDV